MPITVSVHQRLAGTDAEMLSLEGMYETAQAGHLLGLHVSPDNSVIIVYEDGDAAAIIVYSEYEDVSEFWIHFGYCRPLYRRKGHYRACIEKLKEIAKDLGYNRIHTAAHPSNNIALESIRSRGGELQYLGYVFPVD